MCSGILIIGWMQKKPCTVSGKTDVLLYTGWVLIAEIKVKCKPSERRKDFAVQYRPDIFVYTKNDQFL